MILLFNLLTYRPKRTMSLLTKRSWPYCWVNERWYKLFCVPWPMIRALSMPLVVRKREKDKIVVVLLTFAAGLGTSRHSSSWSWSVNLSAFELGQNRSLPWRVKEELNWKQTIWFLIYSKCSKMQSWWKCSSILWIVQILWWQLRLELSNVTLSSK